MSMTIITRVLWEGRLAGAKTLYTAGDFNVSWVYYVQMVTTSKNSMRCNVHCGGKDATMIEEYSRS